MSSDSTAEATLGGRTPTMADIARHLGVSRQLVSLALRDQPGASAETRRRVRAAAVELEYRPHTGARSLRRARSGDLGVIFSPAHSTEPEIVESIYPASATHGYGIILSAQTATRSTNQAVEELLGHRCAAVIVIGSNLTHAALRAIVARSPVPLVDVGHGRRNAFYDVVRSAGNIGIASAVDHVVTLGHQDITYVDPASMPPAGLRRKGYRQAAKRLGLTEDVITVKGDYTEWNYFEEAGSRAAHKLLERGHMPTAVVVPNDHAAVGLINILLKNGVRVPEDVSVTGFDDAPIARLTSVDLTTVKQDPGLMGMAAVEAAVRRIERQKLAPGETVVETSLVLRGTTAAPADRRLLPRAAASRGRAM